jgi:sortase A
MRTRVARSIYHIFLTLGLFAVGYAGFVYTDSYVYQESEARKFRQFEPGPERRILARGDVIGEIQVPRLGLHAIVVQGDSPEQLRRAVGHLPRSVLPGEWGNVALAGHRDTFFLPLHSIRVGDEIRFVTRQGTFEYQVRWVKVVAPTDIRVLESSTGHELTLVTCFPFRYIGPAPQRFIVRGQEVSRPLREFAKEGDAPSGQTDQLTVAGIPEIVKRVHK